jgi:hypothetical protein
VVTHAARRPAGTAGRHASKAARSSCRRAAVPRHTRASPAPGGWRPRTPWDISSGGCDVSRDVPRWHPLLLRGRGPRAAQQGGKDRCGRHPQPSCRTARPPRGVCRQPADRAHGLRLYGQADLSTVDPLRQAIAALPPDAGKIPPARQPGIHRRRRGPRAGHADHPPIPAAPAPALPPAGPSQLLRLC